MADHRARELERRALADPGARAPWLRERARSGERSVIQCGTCEGSGLVASDNSKAQHRARSIERRCRPDKEAPRRDAQCGACEGTGFRPFLASIELAAYCGDRAARTVLACRPCGGTGRMPPPPPVCVACDAKGWGGPWRCSDEFSEWVQDLDRYGHYVQVRAAVVASRVAHRAKWICGFRYLGRDCPCCVAHRAIVAAEAWVRCPCEEHARQVPHYRVDAGIVDLPTWVPRGYDVSATLRAQGFGPRARGDLGHRVRESAAEAGEKPVRAAISEDLIGWALE